MDAVMHGRSLRGPGTSDPAALRAQARGKVQQFEELFVQQMVGALRQSAGFGDEDGGLFGSGPGADTYAQWFDQNLAHEVSRSGHVGIADVLMRDLERNHEIPPLPRPVPRTAAPVRRGAVDVAA